MDLAAAIIQVLLALVFTGSGVANLAGVRMQVENFQRYGYPQWFRVVTGAVALIGAAGMVAGLFAEGIAVAAAVWLSAMMVGATYTEVRSSPLAMAVAPVVLLALNVAVAALRLAD